MAFRLKIGKAILTCSGLAFDKDGTLTDGFALWRGMFEARSALITSEFGDGVATLWAEMTGVESSAGLKIDPFGPLAMGSLSQETIVLAVCLYRKLKMPWDACIDTAESLLLRADATLEPSQLSKPLPGVPDKLFELKAAGVPLALVTMDSRPNVDRTIGSLGLEGVFDCVVTPDDQHPPKPSPQMLLAAAEHLGLKPSDLLMVGDSRADARMAQAAGAACVLVGSDAASGLAISPPPAFIDSLDQIELVGSTSA